MGSYLKIEKDGHVICILHDLQTKTVKFCGIKISEDTLIRKILLVDDAFVKDKNVKVNPRFMHIASYGWENVPEKKVPSFVKRLHTECGLPVDEQPTGAYLLVEPKGRVSIMRFLSCKDWLKIAVKADAIYQEVVGVDIYKSFDDGSYYFAGA